MGVNKERKALGLKGYLVSYPRIPQGKFFKTFAEARKEMDRQMFSGSSESGISEVK